MSCQVPMRSSGLMRAWATSTPGTSVVTATRTMQDLSRIQFSSTEGSVQSGRVLYELLRRGEAAVDIVRVVEQGRRYPNRPRPYRHLDIGGLKCRPNVGRRLR